MSSIYLNRKDVIDASMLSDSTNEVSKKLVFLTFLGENDRPETAKVAFDSFYGSNEFRAAYRDMVFMHIQMACSKLNGLALESSEWKAKWNQRSDLLSAPNDRLYVIYLLGCADHTPDGNYARDPVTGERHIHTLWMDSTRQRAISFAGKMMVDFEKFLCAERPEYGERVQAEESATKTKLKTKKRGRRDALEEEGDGEEGADERSTAAESTGSAAAEAGQGSSSSSVGPAVAKRPVWRIISDERGEFAEMDLTNDEADDVVVGEISRILRRVKSRTRQVKKIVVYMA